MFKGLGNIASLMKQAGQMRSKMDEMNAELQGQTVEGSAGAGMVKVECNGMGEATKVTIDPSLFESGDREMIEELLPAAFNQAITKSKQLQAESMRSLTDGMNVPGLEDALKQMTGVDPTQPGG